MSRAEDPLLRNSRREATVIGLVWVGAMVYCCTYSYLFGYSTPSRPLGPADVRPIFGMPSWVFWGYVVPWAVCAVFTIVFTGFFMVDDDLGVDHTLELEADIRDGSQDGPER